MATSTLDIKFHIHSTLFRRLTRTLPLLLMIIWFYMYLTIHPTLFAPDCAICFAFAVSFQTPIASWQILGPIVYTYSCLFLRRRSTDVSFSPFQVSISSVFISRYLVSYHELYSS